ncbi:MAG: replication-associated recombination protein A [Candidatus Schekmanbacteria bacterium]|nr:replication-associated recombination protein A [Candidatus Schekmanbacteria bacterium]
MELPLAERLRPRSLTDVVGHAELLAPGKPLHELLARGKLCSAVFWGPPGCGKTTLARLLGQRREIRFMARSAVLSGTAEVKQIMQEAAAERQRGGRKTVLFLDEIHRFNRAQQDAFLPFVERGDVCLIGATTENPSFSLNSALLSRMRVFVLAPLSPADVQVLLRRALDELARRYPPGKLGAADEALGALAVAVAGDARRALTALEIAAAIAVEKDAEISLDLLTAALGQALRYDRAGEEHFNLISAVHKSIRNSDADAAVYWTVRMLAAGDDPLYIARRLVRIASEDVGLADPAALGVAIAARDTYQFLGSPEGELALVQLAIYLAHAPKSNAAYLAEKAARADVERHGALPVPRHLRNAVTKLMQSAGYGVGYTYAHDLSAGVADMTCLPDELAEQHYYAPTNRGFEGKLLARAQAIAEARAAQRRQDAGDA